MTVTSAKFNIPESTLRYYEKKGLLPLMERDEAGRRLFSERSVLASFLFIRHSFFNAVYVLREPKIRYFTLGQKVGDLCFLIDLGKGPPYSRKALVSLSTFVHKL
ncbi:MerR family DNA-binding transcriptional regulator [Bacillus enclensis]|nr:MerR family DNA-binding transcriptional regulator [[Bacillus] enclensis]